MNCFIEKWFNVCVQDCFSFKITAEDIIEERDNEIRNLKSLVDSLRACIEQLKEEQHRQTLLDKESGPVSSYDMYI